MHLIVDSCQVPWIKFSPSHEERHAGRKFQAAERKTSTDSTALTPLLFPRLTISFSSWFSPSILGSIRIGVGMSLESWLIENQPLEAINP
jgi:hypothetical protein